MTISELYKAHYEDYRDFVGSDEDKPTKYEWAASEIFDLTTYDGSMDELFVKKIIEVIKVILDRHNFEYINDENNYISYLAVCQLLVKYDWIDWGTSIRGAWINESCYEKTKPILDSNLEKFGCSEIRFCEAHITALINFIEEDQS
jgi:hypothetical protein